MDFLAQRAQWLCVEAEVARASLDYVKAEELLHLASELTPDADLQMKLADVRFEMGRYDQAMDAALNVIHLDPDCDGAFILISQCLDAKGFQEEAQEWLKLTERQPQPSVQRAHLHLGDILEKRNLWFSAFRSFQNAADRWPEHIESQQAFASAKQRLFQSSANQEADMCS